MTSFWVFNVVTSKYGPLHHKLGFYSFIYLFTFILRTLDTNLAKRRYFGVLTSIWCFDVIYWRNVGFRGSLIRRTLLNDFTSYNISFLKFLSKNLLISWIIAVFLNWRHFGYLTSYDVVTSNLDFSTFKCAIIVLNTYVPSF